MMCVKIIKYRYEFDHSWLRMYFVIPIDIQRKTIFNVCSNHNEYFDIDLSVRAPRTEKIIPTGTM